MRGRTIAAALLAIVLIAAPAASVGTVAQAAHETAVRVEAYGLPLALKKAPIREGSTILVPLREIAAALSAELEAQDIHGGGKLMLTREGRTAALTIGSREMTANGRTVTLPAAPKLVGGVTMVPLRAVSEALGERVEWDGKSQTVRIGKPAELPTVGTPAKLKELLEQMRGRSGSRIMLSIDGVIMEATVVDQAATADGASAGASAGAADTGSSGSAPPASDDAYSKTNVQVDGVDEADWAKTDGNFIYQLSGSSLFIADIRGGGVPKLAAKIEYDEQDGFYPQEMYVSGGKLVVIGHYHEPLEPEKPAAGAAGGGVSGSSAAASDMIGIMPIYPMHTSVQALVYTLSDAGVPALERQLELEGSYLSSRMVGSSLYLVASKHHHYYAMPADDGLPDPAAFEPVYRDSAVSDTKQTIPLEALRYFPDSPETSTLLIGAVDLAEQQEMQVSAYLGAGGTVYASPDHLYVAVTRYEWPEAAVAERGAKRIAQPAQPKEETAIYKFRLNGGRTAYASSGTVRGSVLNQFAMDEYDGYFRIATTSGQMWAAGEATSKNNLYVLNGAMQTVGELEDLAPGERIYSVRYMGSRAYMVTFRNVDPLFAIDVSDPAAPNVLGQLKIPGYSDYLHPYDEQHLIGFGKETALLPVKGAGPDEVRAFDQGMKISLFDVTDVTQPKEKFKTIIGDRGTHSELLYNHKALLFDREMGLMAFPVDLMEVKQKPAHAEDAAVAYGEFVFQGAYVYHVDAEDGFQLRGRITHLSADDLAKAGTYGYDYTKAVRRILYAGDTLYTLSDAMVKASALDTLAETGSLGYPVRPFPRYDILPVEEIAITE